MSIQSNYLTVNLETCRAFFFRSLRRRLPVAGDRAVVGRVPAPPPAPRPTPPRLSHPPASQRLAGGSRTRCAAAATRPTVRRPAARGRHQQAVAVRGGAGGAGHRVVRPPDGVYVRDGARPAVRQRRGGQRADRGGRGGR